jgi:hypothetical protein
MLKNIFLILSVCILFFGCTNSKKTTEYTINSNETELLEDSSEYSIGNSNEVKLRIFEHKNYNNSINSFSIRSISDIIFLEKFSQDELSEYIEELQIGYDSEVRDLKFMENFSFLKGLHIVLREDFDNIEALNNLNNLELLAIRSSIDILPMPITNLQNIKYLEIGNNFKNISTIANFKKLEYLTFHWYKDIDDVDFIFNLFNLTHLVITGGVPDLTHIGKLQKLEYLVLHKITQDGLNNLANLKKLKNLSIEFLDDIDDISPLLNLPSIESLDFISFDFDIMPLATIKSLRSIKIPFGSGGDIEKFLDNEGKIFSENGINIYSHDWR